MFAMIKRILNLAGKHKSKILLGILFNFLKSVCMAMVLWAVYIVASDLDSLTMDVIWKAAAGAGMVISSVRARSTFRGARARFSSTSYSYSSS